MRSVVSVICWLSMAAPFGCVGELEPEIDEEETATVEHKISFAGHDYLFVSALNRWHPAQTYCANYDASGGGGYHLVVINDATEEAFLHERERLLLVHPSKGWWIGYSDQGIEGSWIWSSGVSTFANWAPGEPNSQDCAIDNHVGGNGWAARGCGETHLFICERDSIAAGNKGIFNFQASNTSSATVNTTQFSIFLFAGQLFTFGTCGLPGAAGSGDTYLRIRRPSGVEITGNDDFPGCGVSSNLSIVPDVTGTHVIHAGCYSSGACSGTVAFNY